MDINIKTIYLCKSEIDAGAHFIRQDLRAQCFWAKLGWLIPVFEATIWGIKTGPQEPKISFLAFNPCNQGL